jgi:hypothetical protein
MANEQEPFTPFGPDYPMTANLRRALRLISSDPSESPDPAESKESREAREASLDRCLKLVARLLGSSGAAPNDPKGKTNSPQPLVEPGFPLPSALPEHHRTVAESPTVHSSAEQPTVPASRTPASDFLVRRAVEVALSSIAADASSDLGTLRDEVRSALSRIWPMDDLPPDQKKVLWREAAVIVAKGDPTIEIYLLNKGGDFGVQEIATMFKLTPKAVAIEIAVCD